MIEVSADQAALEHESHDLGVQRYRAATQKLVSDGRISMTKPGRQLVAKSADDLEAAIVLWSKKAKAASGPTSSVVEFLAPLKPRELAYLTIQTLIDSASQGTIRSTTCCYLGSAIRDEAMFRTLKTQHAPLHNRMKGYKVIRHKQLQLAKKWAERGLWSWNLVERPIQVRAGMILFTLALKHTGLFETQSYTYRKHTRVIVTLAPHTLQWISEANDALEVLTPRYLPMVQEPLDWAMGQRGGYLTDNAKRKPLCRLQHASHAHEIKNTPMPHVYRAVNLAQRTQWQVNSDVLMVLEDLWTSNAAVAGIPDRDEPEFSDRPHEPHKNDTTPEAEESREVLRAWQRHKSQAIDTFKDEGSARLRIARTLASAKKFSDSTVYFPHFLDWRCRLYPVPQYLNHQGADQARGLLQFARPCTVEHGSSAAELFEDYGTGLWKGEIPEGLVEAVSDDPLGCLDWKDADKPWQFLSWCLDAAPWRADEGHGVRVPIQADGTNNGLQIYSLLMRDETMARATNVSPGPRADIYQEVADKVWERVKADPSEMASMWRVLLPDGIPRGCVKQPVMATPYGIKQHTSTGYIRNWLLRLQKELGTEPWGHSTFKPAQYLSDLVWEEVGQFIKPAAECMDWLRAMAAAVNGEIGWTTPAGFPVKQNYRSTRQKQVLAVVEGERKWSTHRSAPGGLNKNKQRNGLPPNYIHSLDSAALVLTMNRCADKGVRDFSMIHDSYGCPAADTPTMNTTLREVFAEMFSGNLMLDLYHQVQQQHPTAEIPLPPSQGTLDPSVVINSQHFFAA